MIVVPVGYTAYLIGYGTSFDEAAAFVTAEEARPEGALMAMELDFEEPLTAEQLVDLNSQLASAGVPPWPGYAQAACIGTTRSSLHIYWTKGFAFTSIIIGMLVLFALPVLLSIGLWHLMPEAMKQLINTVVMVGIVVLMMRMMTPMLAKGKEETS